jgi:tetraacyldisaccharide 4'-kinase
MIFLRKILFPVAMVYWLVTFIRNWFYDRQIFKSYTFKTPTIVVGNLSAGGTGKTPHIELLIRLLSTRKIATLSRGYKRTTKGFVLASAKETAQTIGDEPMQFFTKFPAITVAVDEDRKNGIEQLQKLCDLDVVLLDDAFQHRRVKANAYILLTTFESLFCDDYILPFGNLREPAQGKKRANIIIVTKCPANLTTEKQAEITKKLNVSVSVYFSTIVYDDYVYNETEKIKVTNLPEKVLVAGIAKPDLFFEHLAQPTDVIMIYKDHHNFSENDLQLIATNAHKKIVVTTEKDYMRLRNNLPNTQVYFLPIQTKIINNYDSFTKEIERFL